MELIEFLMVALPTLLVARVRWDHVLGLLSALWSVWLRVTGFVRSLWLPWPLRRVEVSPVFPNTVGYFYHGDPDTGEVQHYFRFPKKEGGQLMRLFPAGGKGVGDKFEVSWTSGKVEHKSCGESALPGSSYKKVQNQVLWKGTFKVNSGCGAYDSMGANIGGCALIAGHALKNRDHVVLTGSNTVTSGVKVSADRFHRPENFYEGGATDFAVAKLTGNEWAMIGAKSLGKSDFAPVSVGAAELQFGRGAEGVLHVSEGKLGPQPKAAVDAGLVVTKVSSEGGASGGAGRRFVGGVPKYTFFHIAKPADNMSMLEGKYNIGINFDVIFSYMREKSLYYDSVYEAVKKAAIGESLDYDIDDAKDRREFFEVNKHYEDDEMWERTQNQIEQQVFGDEWSRYQNDTVGRRARRYDGDSDDSGESRPLVLKLQSKNPICREFRPPPNLERIDEAEGTLGIDVGTLAMPEINQLVGDFKEQEDQEVADVEAQGDESAVATEAPAPLKRTDTEFVTGYEQKEASPVAPQPAFSTSTLLKGVAVAAMCSPLVNLDFTQVKRQVINADFSFAATLTEAVKEHGVTAVHDYVIGTEAFATYREYMAAVTPVWLPTGKSMPDENGKAFFEDVGHYEVDGKLSPTTPDRKKKTKPLSKEGQARAAAVRALIKDLGCEDEDWVTPENTRGNITASMAAHAKMVSVDAPSATEEDWCQALEAGCEDFDTTVLKSHAQQGFEGWYKLAATLADSSPGVSARFRNQSKKQWANDPNLLMTLVDLVECRLILMLIHNKSVANYTPEQAVQNGLKDVLLMSVKREPHRPVKAKQKRFRIIWISSLIDSFVQKLLHKALNARDIDHYQSGELFHSAAGMGHHDEGIEHLCKALNTVFAGEEELLTCDASMWDFTMDKQAHLNHAERRCKSCEDPEVCTLIMTLAHLNYKHLCENKGEVWRCNKEGVNPSGQSSTTSDNTFTRHSQAKVCGAKKFIGNGDDMVADKNFDPEKAKKFGTKSRDVVVQGAEIVPFTSHHIDRANQTASYDRPVKLAWNLLAHCGSQDFGLRVDSMMAVIRNTPDAREKFRRHLGEFGQGTETCNFDLLWAI